MPKRTIDVLILVFFFVLFLAGCSRQTKDKLLRVFFDGVPLPGEEKNIQAQAATKEEVKKEAKKLPALPQEPVLFFHPPFLEKQCDSCHETKFSQRLISKGKELCFSCHDDFTKDKRIVHYPVSQGACLDCHDPHQSSNKFILNKPVPELCFSCHDEKEMKANPAHEGKNTCVECHDIHASNKEKLLK